MKISCTQENLYNSLSVVARIGTKGGALPILNNVLMRVEKIGLIFTTTNLELAVTSIVRGKVEQEGVVAVNAKLLYEMVGLLPKERVDIELEGNNLKFKCGKQTTVLRTTPVEDFPIIPEVVGGAEVEVESNEFLNALSHVLFAINPNNGRPEIAGVRVIINDNLIVVGTDSFRLAEYKIISNQKITNTFTIPLRSAQEIQKIIDGSNNKIKLIFNDNQLKIIINETQIISRLIVGDYPDYLQIIPKDFTSTCVFQREDLIRVVRAAGLFSRTSINDIEIGIDPSNNIAVINAVNMQIGEYSNQIVLNSGSGEKTKIVFNYHYLLEGLQVTKTKEVKLGIVNEGAPGLLTPVGDENYRYLLMPIRQ